MLELKVIFSVDPTGQEKDISEEIYMPNDVCLYCLHDKTNRLIDEVKISLKDKGYDLTYYFELIKIYTI